MTAAFYSTGPGDLHYSTGRYQHSSLSRLETRVEEGSSLVSGKTTKPATYSY